MRHRRKLGTRQSPQQNLDSFLDILTNTVGVLMFIGLFVALLSVESGNIIRTPLVSASAKNAQFFEVRNNQVFYLDNPRVENQLTWMIENLPPCYEPDPPRTMDSVEFDFYYRQLQEYERCQRSRLQQLQGYQISTDYYEAHFDIEGFVTIYQPRPNVTGSSLSAIASDESAFKRTLTRLNSQQDYLAFLVRPDSFAAFRQARKVAWEQGFDVGWEPLSEQRTIAFGSRGRSIGVQ
ncbi:hypothetical protein [Spirulina subsalsa]|uniref:hypothetical protein n=1 Tax=Spirulina subsalsa TaxID=54311 RepID=UPI00030809D7|nr:hypothetical protein [Spirulina subsalsa]